MASREKKSNSKNINIHPGVILFLLIALLGPCAIHVKEQVDRDAVRSKTARLKADMRSLATAIESYRVDQNAYPPHTFDPDYKAKWYSDAAATVFDIRFSLTTPVAFISSYPSDIFHPRGDKSRRSGFAYWSSGQSWMLWSPGPDSVFSIDIEGFQENALTTEFNNQGRTYRVIEDGKAQEWLSRYTWDATNGALSSGDIYQLSTY